jgi:hypothetical protein
MSNDERLTMLRQAIDAMHQLAADLDRDRDGDPAAGAFVYDAVASLQAARRLLVPIQAHSYRVSDAAR